LVSGMSRLSEEKNQAIRICDRSFYVRLPRRRREVEVIGHHSTIWHIGRSACARGIKVEIRVVLETEGAIQKLMNRCGGYSGSHKKFPKKEKKYLYYCK
jgi:hypothetical protein